MNDKIICRSLYMMHTIAKGKLLTQPAIGAIVNDKIVYYK